jgi:hypothetical protein
MPEASVGHVSVQHVVGDPGPVRCRQRPGRGVTVRVPAPVSRCPPQLPRPRWLLEGPGTSSPTRRTLPSAFGRNRRQAARCLAAVANGTSAASPAHETAIKDTIALHYARSAATPPRALPHLRQGVGRVRTLWMTDWHPELESTFYRARGFYAAGGLRRRCVRPRRASRW